ncbi:nuclear transport factor 2 family protein [Mycolicibacterium sp. P9-64]|uniref:nuclear transport factor 2 family protein n=1 Tax=Mycolicibacterium sp. P9-64 TaxID=2024612 RepID=UPI0011ECF4A8|nr:nuclear transport factor 2 family protein [Mycolicibacterium sp. P9-64]KAA0081733.1 nuclear transport factor 2 family protein [Mycolicibacterium sp. P9-64]
MKPQELVSHAFGLLLAQDVAAFAGLWAEDGVLEFPFAAPGYPALVEGRAAIAEYMRGYPDILKIEEIPQPVVHQSVDPEVVIVEFEASGTVVATGAPYRMRYIAVITVRDGEIQRYRDYWSPLAAAEAMGGQERLHGFGGGGGE